MKPEERYRKEVGRDARNLPEDHPDVWQWKYRGTKAEQEELLERLGLENGEAPTLIEGQEELFGG